MKKKRTVLIAVVVAAACVAGGVLAATVGFALGGFEWSALDSRSMVTREYTMEEDFTRIAIDVAVDVVFLPAEDGVCRVVCHDWEKHQYEVTVTADTLAVRYSDVSRWYEHIVVLSTGNPTVTVYLPKTDYASLVLHTVSGDIRIGSGYSFWSRSAWKKTRIWPPPAGICSWMRRTAGLWRLLPPAVMLRPRS